MLQRYYFLFYRKLYSHSLKVRYWLFRVVDLIVIDNTINEYYLILFESFVVKLLLFFCQGHLNFLLDFLNL